jgi:hypothetical protein
MTSLGGAGTVAEAVAVGDGIAEGEGPGDGWAAKEAVPEPITKHSAVKEINLTLYALLQ